MTNTVSSNSLWMKFFIIKLLEYVLVWSIIGIHLSSQIFYRDYILWDLLIIGTEIGYCIILSNLLLNGLLRIRAQQSVHGFFNLIGCALFIISGIRIIYYYKNLYDTVYNSNLPSPFHQLRNNGSLNDIMNNFLSFFSFDTRIDLYKNEFTLGFLRGCFNIVEGLILLIDSLFVFYNK